MSLLICTVSAVLSVSHNGPAQIILLPIALVSDKGSEEPAYMYSVSSAFRLT